MVAITPSFISALTTSPRARRHAVGQFLNSDAVRQNNVTHHFHLIRSQPFQFRLTPLALTLPAHRGQLRTRSSSPSIAACTSMRPARRPISVPFLATATCGLRGTSAPPGRRIGRASSSSSAARAGPQPQRLGRRRRRRGSRRRRRATPCLLRPARGRIGRLRRNRGLGHLARRLLGFLLRLFRGLALGILFGCLARFLLAPARLLGRRQDGYRLLLAPLSLAPRRLPLLLDQRPLARRKFRRGQRAWRRRRSGTSTATGRGSARNRRRRTGGAPAPAPAPVRQACATVARFLRTSTCTTLDRPWLKLCRTEPASTVRPSSRRPAGRSESRPLPAS